MDQQMNEQMNGQTNQKTIEETLYTMNKLKTVWQPNLNL